MQSEFVYKDAVGLTLMLSCFPIVGGALFGSSCISQSPYDRRCMGPCEDVARYPRVRVTRLIHHTHKCLANITGPLQVSQGSVIFILRDGKQAEDLHGISNRRLGVRACSKR